jgi:hypothetical protein
VLLVVVAKEDPFDGRRLLVCSDRAWCGCPEAYSMKALHQRRIQQQARYDVRARVFGFIVSAFEQRGAMGCACEAM